MKYEKIGFYVGAVAGLVLFAAAWLLPVAFIGGVSGAKIQEYVSGNAQGVLAVAFMALVVLVSGALITAFTSFVGWVGGVAIGALTSPKPSTATDEALEPGFNVSPVKAE